MGPNKNRHGPTSRRRASSSSTDSSISTGSSHDSSTDSRISISPTTPSSSFNESPSTPTRKQPPFTSPPFPPKHRAPSPTYESWRAGSDLPEAFKHKPYISSHPSHTKPGVSRLPRPPTPARPHNVGDSSSRLPTRPAISVVLPQPIPNVRQASSEKQYVNLYGQITTQPSHSAPYDLPLVSIGLGPTGEWTYSLPLTLEELFSGVHIKFPIVRRLLSGRSRTVTLDLEIPPGCRPTSRLFCRRVGHEIKSGLLQDIAFIIEEKPHSRFTRLEMRDDLVLDVHVPLADSLRQCGTEASFTGIDGKPLSVLIEYPRTKAPKGRNVIKGAGMPVRYGGKVVGRGDLIVQWEIVPETEQPKILHFVKRLWKK